MTYGLSQYIAANPATGLIVGQEVSAWIGSRFSPVNTPPATNGSPPGGSPDYGPTATTSIAGCAFAVTTTDEFILSVYDPADTSNGGTYNTYWYGPYLIDPSTNLVGWTAAADQQANRPVYVTTIASGSNGAVLPQTTINVASNVGFPTSGALVIATTAGVYTGVTYSGVSGTTQFTGCAGGTGTLVTNHDVGPAFVNGNYRRICFVSAISTALAANDNAECIFISTVGGSVIPVSRTGQNARSTATFALTAEFTATFPVDPLGIYGYDLATAGTGIFTWAAGSGGHWIEVDF